MHSINSHFRCRILLQLTQQYILDWQVGLFIQNLINTTHDQGRQICFTWNVRTLQAKDLIGWVIKGHCIWLTGIPVQDCPIGWKRHWVCGWWVINDLDETVVQGAVGIFSYFLCHEYDHFSLTLRSLSWLNICEKLEITGELSTKWNVKIWVRLWDWRPIEVHISVQLKAHSNAWSN